MTRDPAAQAVHERLEHAASAISTFDVDAGWAALAAQLEGPVAPVIPLRRRRPRRAVALAVAAAVFIGGSALAMVRHAEAPGLSIAPVVILPSSGVVTGPHVHAAFSGAPPPPGSVTGPGSTDRGGAGGSGSHQPSGSGSSGGESSQDGSGGSGGSGTPNQDSPDDIDHGSGNDGHHDDNGRGNNARGPQPPGGSDAGGGGSEKSHGSSSAQAIGH